MPDPVKQRAQNEQKLFAEGIRVPFYQTQPSGDYELDSDQLPVLDHSVQALPFVLETASGSEFSLDPAQFDGYLLIFAIPTFDGPNTLQQLEKLSDWGEDLKAAGIDTVALSVQPASKLKILIDDHQWNLLLLSDPQRVTAVDYGFCTAEMEFPQRTMVGIGPGGEIVFYTRGFAYSSVGQIKQAFGLED